MRVVVVGLAILTACGAQTAPRDDPAAAPTSPEPTLSLTPSPPSPNPAPAPEFSAARAKHHVRVLANRIGPRPAGSRGYRKAVRYVQREFDLWGWTTRLQAFRTSNGTRSWNVIAVLPGGSQELVVGAHLDTVPGSPGANDNGTGIGILLELARVLAAAPEGTGVVLVAFGAEERQPAGGHHVGSQVYVRRMPTAPRMMASVDMVGRAREVVIGWIGIGKRAAVRALKDAALAEGIPARARRMPDVSDHGPFERAGVPAALLWTGPHPDYHSPRDDLGDVQRKALSRLGRLLLRFIRTAAGEAVG